MQLSKQTYGVNLGPTNNWTLRVQNLDHAVSLDIL